MFKKILLILILTVAFMFAQENSIPVKEWKTSGGTTVSSGTVEGGLFITSIAAASIFSQDFEIFDNKWPNFDQEIMIVITADSLTWPGDTVKTDVDSIDFYPMYHLGQSYGWFTGAKMTLFAVTGDITFDSTETGILLPGLTGLTFLYNTTPTIAALVDTPFVQKSEWDKFKLKATMTGDSNYFNLSADIIIRETK